MMSTERMHSRKEWVVEEVGMILLISSHPSLAVAAPLEVGGGSSRGGGRMQRRGEDVVHLLKVSLEDLYLGTTKKLSLSRNTPCSKCNGVCHSAERAPKVQEKRRRPLCRTHTLSLTEALCGFSFVLTHLDGRNLLIKSYPGDVVKPDSYKAISDEGMPIYQRPFMKGKLYIHFTVDFPDSLSPDQTKSFVSSVWFSTF
ncbi:chaperone protein dnaJ 3-like [Raphanus sativus]|uniref:Chaperone protein dnaJ 3-like n=1 Tax=Raphanus sativus TaxID=3726 RepID=A0A6J0JUX8_RAPSA|nr:chaperone protein dnaJ 3-like [Raphanus sativus]